MSRPTRPGSTAITTYSSGEWAKTALGDTMQKSPITYTDREVDTFYEWIAAHYKDHPKNDDYCFAAEVRQEWPRADFESLLTTNGLTAHDVMYTIMSDFADGGSLLAPGFPTKFANNQFIDTPTDMCLAMSSRLPNSVVVVGSVLQKYMKAGTNGRNGENTNGNGGDSTSTPFHKSIWFWLLVVIVLIIVVAVTSKK